MSTATNDLPRPMAEYIDVVGDMIVCNARTNLDCGPEDMIDPETAEIMREDARTLEGLVAALERVLEGKPLRLPAPLFDYLEILTGQIELGWADPTDADAVADQAMEVALFTELADWLATFATPADAAKIRAWDTERRVDTTSYRNKTLSRIASDLADRSN